MADRRSARRRSGLAVSPMALGAVLGAIAITPAGSDVARAERARSGHLTVLVSDAASSSAMDRGGPSRDGRIARSLTGTRHHVIARHVIPSRRVGPPVEWTIGRVAFGTRDELRVLHPDGRATSRPLAGIEVRPVVLPSGELFVVTNESRALVLTPDLELRAEATDAILVRVGPLVLDDGSVVVIDAEHDLVRFDGALRPLFRTPLPRITPGLPRAPALLRAEGVPPRVVVADGERLFVVDLRGVLLRTVDLGERVAADPAIDARGDVHVLTSQGTILVVEAARRIRRRIALGARIADPNATLALASDGSYRVALPARGVIALSPTGDELWVATNDAPFHGPLAIDPEDRTLAYDRRGRLFLISREGEILERIELGALANEFPLVARDGTLWARTDAGEIVHVGVEARPNPP